MASTSSPSRLTARLVASFPPWSRHNLDHQGKRLTETLSITICRGNSLGDDTGTVIKEIQQILKSRGK